MARKLKTRKDAQQRAREGKSRRVLMLVVLSLLGMCVLMVGAVAGLVRLRSYVMSQPMYAQNFAEVELVDKTPDEWLNRQLAAEMLDPSQTSNWTFNPKLAQSVYDRASMCPWVLKLNEVRVERVRAQHNDGLFSTGRVLVKAQWRKPVAIVKYGQDNGPEEYVDESGYILPKHQVRGLVLPRIVGVATQPPQIDETTAIQLANGNPDVARRLRQKWEGEDVQAGLTMIKTLSAKPYFNEIVVINVANHANRRSLAEPAIRLVAQRGDRVTDIKFGRLPINGLPMEEPSTQHKMWNLDSLAVNPGFGARASFDLRLNDATISNE